MTEHSSIGPSALHRLLACPGSHKLSQGVPKGASSFYAAEGTLCHEIVEDALRRSDFVPPVDKSLGSVHDIEGHAITVDADMLAGADMMIAFCQSLSADADQTWVEQRVDLGHHWDGNPPEPIFGTVDFGAYIKSVDTLYCVDLKYGRLPVVPHENPQQNAYASGMIHELGFTPGHVANVIVQPRDHTSAVPIKVAKMTGLDLMIWEHDVLVPGVDALFGPAPELSPGDHCRFCPAKAACPALVALAQTKAKASFSQTPQPAVTYTDEELGDVLNWASTLKLWIDEIQAEACGRIEHGSTVPNWKLVPKRASRKWDNEAEVTKLAEGKDDLFTRKLKNPTQLEKADKAFYQEVSNHVVKQSSGTTLAPDLDPREAVARVSAKDQFSET